MTPTQPTHARSPFRVDIVEQHYYPTFGPEEYYSTFVHEFGHSAFASAVGSGLQFIYVRPDGNGGTAGGHMRHDGITDRHGRSHRQSQAAMSLSGPVAEYLTFGTLPRTLGGWSGDRRKLVENLGRYKAPSYLGAKAPDFIYTMVAEMQLDRLSGTVNGRPVVIDFDLLAMALYEAYTVVGSRIAKVQRLARRYADRRVSRITGGAVTTIETELSTTDLGGNEVVCR